MELKKVTVKQGRHDRITEKKSGSYRNISVRRQ